VQDATRSEIMTIWVNEQIDACGILHSCIACCDETQALECHESFQDNLSDYQKAEGWTARLRKVETWDEVPVNALKLD
jgi:adenylosuccinate synthase